jgi:hypothetical protein
MEYWSDGKDQHSNTRVLQYPIPLRAGGDFDMGLQRLIGSR